MRHEFNNHIEKVHHVEVESDKSLEDVTADAVKAYKEGRLQLGEGEWLTTEFWDAHTGDLVDELSTWAQ